MAVSVSEKREELSISSARARLWISVFKNFSVALFSSPEGEKRSIQITSSILKVSRSAIDWDIRIAPLDL